MASSPTYNANLMVAAERLQRRSRRSRARAATRRRSSEQRDRGPLSAGLDVQARDRRRPRSTPARTRRPRPSTTPATASSTASASTNSGNPDSAAAGGVRQRHARAGLEHSINSVFCNVGKHIGGREDPRVREALRLLLGAAARHAVGRERGVRPLQAHGTALVARRTRTTGQIDSGRLAFGQERMLATPLQMALVGATIANGGIEPKPYLVQKVVAPDGSTVSKTTPQMLGRPIKPQTAAELNQMMQLVVQGGTAAASDSRRPQGRRQDGNRGARTSATSTTPGSSASPRRTTRATSSRSSSRSSRTASAPRSRPRSPRPSSKTYLRLADHVFTL